MVLIVLGGLGCSKPEGSEATRAPANPGELAAVQLTDLSNRVVRPFHLGTPRGLVFLFLSSDCPISNKYAPEMQRLQTRFGSQGIDFWRVYPNPSTTLQEAQRHGADFNLAFGGLRDPLHLLVRRAGVTVTPEAAVFTPDGRLVYRGRIDDRFPALGTERAAPTTHDLQAALEELLAGTPQPPRLTSAVGCFISDQP